jgi:hypothetical protein
MTATFNESLAVLVRSWIVSAVGGSPKVFWDHPVGEVKTLPRYCIIGPLTDNSSEFIGESFTGSITGTNHSLLYDIEIWSDNGKEAITQLDKIENYILTNRATSTFGSNGITNVEIVGQNYRYENEVKIHRRILTIRLSVVNER